MKALVLGGGSIKGAWQAGAIRYILGEGYVPDFISGISVGSMNGVFITNEFGRRGDMTSRIAGLNLWDFWVRRIRKPSDVAIKRKAVSLIWQVLRKKFDGLTDTSPLRLLLYEHINMDHVRNSPIKLVVGCVNLADGQLVYAPPHYSNFLDYVVASTAIPLMMPVEKIGLKPFYDGGLRDSAPLKVAIDNGATEIICIANHPENMKGSELDTGNVMELANRVMEIVSNNNLNNDIREAQRINKLLNQGSESSHLKGKNKIKITIIRPEESLGYKVSDFDKQDILDMLNSGYDTARKVMG